MRYDLTKVSLSDSVLMDKVFKDVEQGVRLHSSVDKSSEVAKSWTDTKDWQFSVVGLLKGVPVPELQRFEIQSYGASKYYVRLKADFNDLMLEVSLEKLGDSFAQIEEVNDMIAKEFLEAFMNSTFNRTNTSEMFEEYAEDEDYFNWLVY